jgi:D-alanyl-D-alanine dipeptidase
MEAEGLLGLSQEWRHFDYMEWDRDAIGKPPFDQSSAVIK